jgi:hypothetical protein
VPNDGMTLVVISQSASGTPDIRAALPLTGRLNLTIGGELADARKRRV